MIPFFSYSEAYQYWLVTGNGPMSFYVARYYAEPRSLWSRNIVGIYDRKFYPEVA